MSQTLPSESSLWPILFRIDEEIRDQTQSLGCQHCGGKLHQANFTRKPRGNAEDLELAYKLRFGLCCGTTGCRLRTLPSSSRFLGRRVYLGVIVVLVAAFRQGPNVTQVKKLTNIFGADRRTIERWCKWWREDFQQGAQWRQLRGALVGSDDPVPRRFILAFDADSDAKNQSLMMSFLCGKSP